MRNKKVKIGIVGCGTIGSQLARAIEERFPEQAELFALCDVDINKAEKIKMGSAANPKILSLNELINCSDLIIESASVKISYEVAVKVLKKGKDVIVMSVGGLLQKAEQLFSLAQEKGGHIYLPSGAIGGLDAVKAASMAEIKTATLITRKPIRGLQGAPYLEQNGIDLSKIDKETVIFEGPAIEAIKGFPKNVNVCGALSLAGIGAQRTQVRIITSPTYKANTHEIQLEGDFGKLLARTENVPTSSNPKTSYLASLSAVATLKNTLTAFKIGT